MSKTEANLLAADKIVGIIVLAICAGVAGTWLYQNYHPVAMVVNEARKNAEESENVFSYPAKFPTTTMPPYSFPKGNPLEGHFKAQEESMRKVRESLRARGIRMPED
jgi:hypothetical protein